MTTIAGRPRRATSSPLISAEAGAGAHRAERDERHRQPFPRQQAGDDAADRELRADRDVDLPRQDDDRHAAGDDQQRRGADDEVAQVDRIEEGRRDRRDQRQQRRPGQGHPQRTVHASRASSPGCAAPRLRGADCQRRVAEGQRHQPLLGGVGVVEHAGQPAAAHHADAMGEAEQLGQLGRDQEDGEAVGGERANQPVDLGLGADVDALRRLVEDEEARLRRQPAGERDLLLVAAGERAHRRVDRRRADGEVGDEALRLGALGGAIEQAETAEGPRRPSEASAVLAATDIAPMTPCCRRSSGT